MGVAARRELLPLRGRSPSNPTYHASVRSGFRLPGAPLLTGLSRRAAPRLTIHVVARRYSRPHVGRP
jgi:hypothetical protein